MAWSLLPEDNSTSLQTKKGFMCQGRMQKLVLTTDKFLQLWIRFVVKLLSLTFRIRQSLARPSTRPRSWPVRLLKLQKSYDLSLFFTFYTDKQFYDISLNVNPGVLSCILVKNYLMRFAVLMRKITKLAACRRGATNSYFKNLQCALRNWKWSGSDRYHCWECFFLLIICLIKLS